ncbi:hypothetical protein FRX31_015715, partial [Thalictrum thalictroides]
SLWDRAATVYIKLAGCHIKVNTERAIRLTIQERLPIVLDINKAVNRMHYI